MGDFPADVISRDVLGQGDPPLLTGYWRSQTPQNQDTVSWGSPQALEGATGHGEPQLPPNPRVTTWASGNNVQWVAAQSIPFCNPLCVRLLDRGEENLSSFSQLLFLTCQSWEFTELAPAGKCRIRHSWKHCCQQQSIALEWVFSFGDRSPCMQEAGVRSMAGGWTGRPCRGSRLPGDPCCARPWPAIHSQQSFLPEKPLSSPSTSPTRHPKDLL